MILALFFNPYHSHSCSHSEETAVSTEHHPDTDHHSSEDDKSDCGNECACPQHRVNGCAPFTALAKNERFILLEVVSATDLEASFSAKQSPILEGPFQPPRA